MPQSVGDEALARMFRAFPGMEYCDLKKDRMTGRSKVGPPPRTPPHLAAQQAKMLGWPMQHRGMHRRPGSASLRRGSWLELGGSRAGAPRSP